ncbi:MAG TPA: hypothetical protein PKL24_22900 [Polyangiaceae bacterium]|nr:MAG: hypothetical protein BWY17_03643 [Deltaproteobacteria bacterium ADurb.Bin207]HNZ25011.1 hypothetical protein [Polyangiaceae bacterium]HOD23924.1 hypothetical protein [Polyangiaceae bacterium]HOE51171.1 hypothetical protein [Polyangiaceae bacterium]HOH03089.1 hypothetical protein [Polyangiaceae bacterium]
MPDHRQKRLAKQKKKRAHVSRAAMSYAAPDELRRVERAVADQILQFPVGPCFITQDWQNPAKPRLHCLVATRRLQDNKFLPTMFLLDFGCQGVLDAYFAEPMGNETLSALLDKLHPVFPQGFESIDPSIASRIVGACIQYATKLGFELKPELFSFLSALSEHIDTTIDIEFGRGGKPLYCPNPNEDTRPIVKRLVEAVGPDGFNVELPHTRGTSP